MIFSIISSVLLIMAIAFIIKLTPEQVSDDIMNILRPNDSLRDKARNLRGNKKKHLLYRKLIRMKTALSVTGKSKQFALVCCASLVLFAGGAILSVLINNLFLMPVLSITFAILPYLYTANTLAYYEKHTKEELETTLSVITTSYIRPPLREVFQAFIDDAIAVSSNTKRALLNLHDKINNEIFREWCDTLIQC